MAKVGVNNSNIYLKLKTMKTLLLIIATVFAISFIIFCLIIFRAKFVKELNDKLNNDEMGFIDN